MKYEASKDSLDGYSKEDKAAIQLFCVSLSKNSWFPLFFGYYVNKYVTDCILEIQKKRKLWLPTTEWKLTEWLEALESLRDEIVWIAWLTEELAAETAKKKS